MALGDSLRALIDMQQAAEPQKDASLDEIIIEWRTDTRLDAVRSALTGLLPGAAFSVSPLIEGAEGPMARFFVIALPSVSLAELPGGPFSLAHQLHDALDLASSAPSFREAGPGFPASEPEITEVSEKSAAARDREWHLKNTAVPMALYHSEQNGVHGSGEGITIVSPDTGRTGHVLVDHMFKAGHGYVEPEGTADDPLGYLGNPGHGLAVGAVMASPGTGLEGGTLRGGAPKAKVWPIRVGNSVVTNLSDNLLRNLPKAVHWAYANPTEQTHIISISLGGIHANGIIGLPQALAEARRAGKIIFAAAGNMMPGFQAVKYPGWDNNTICVAATTEKDVRWQRSGIGMGSCKGPAVTISAPGEDIMVAWRENTGHGWTKIGESSGTSYSTALLAGICAVWLAHFGPARLIEHFGGPQNLQTGFIKALEQSCRRPHGWDTHNMGFGIVDARALLNTLPALSDFSADELAPVEAHVISADDLLAAGADAGLVGKLSPGDIARFGNEILWLTEQGQIASHSGDGKTRTPVMSDELARRLG